MKTLALVAAVLAVTLAPAVAQDRKAGDITVSRAWARATPPQAPAGAVFMTISTAGAPDKLVRVESPAAARAEIHTMSLDGGVMRMRPVTAIEVKPGAAIELKPGGLHVMLMGLTGPLAEGASLKLTLTFEKAGPVEVSVPVRPMAAVGPGGGHHKH